MPSPRLGTIARVLVHACPRLLLPLLAMTGPLPGCLRPYPTPQPPWRVSYPVPMPQACNVSNRPHHTVWRRLFTPSTGALASLNTFWHKVQRWTTNCFSATPTGILAVESYLPPIPLLISQRQRLAALRIVCSPPDLNPATARLNTCFPSLSAHRAHNSFRALTKGLQSVYLHLHWQTSRHTPPIRNPLPIDAVAHKTTPFTQGLSRMPMINSHLISPALAVPPQSLMDNTYSTLKQRVREALLDEWPRLLPTSGYYQHEPTMRPRAFLGLDKFIAGRVH